MRSMIESMNCRGIGSPLLTAVVVAGVVAATLSGQTGTADFFCEDAGNSSVKANGCRVCVSSSSGTVCDRDNQYRETGLTPAAPPEAVVTGVYVNYIADLFNLSGYILNVSHAGRQDWIASQDNGRTPIVYTAQNPNSTFNGQLIEADGGVWLSSIQPVLVNLLMGWTARYSYTVTWRVPEPEFRPSIELPPVFGDWNGDGRMKMGTFSGGTWLLDYNGNGRWDGTAIDRKCNLGTFGDTPVVGDWDGDGRANIGVFNNKGQWVLDYNGNCRWDGTTIDRSADLGKTGDTPVIGDWDGDRRTNIGIFQNNGTWVLDYNGNFRWDGTTIDRAPRLGKAGDVPVVGDWNGDGRTKIAIFSNGTWVLDYNGNFRWDGTTIDRAPALGKAGDVPVVGDWNGDGRTKIAVFSNGTWVLDYNGNFQWDGTTMDRAFHFGKASDRPVTGDWDGNHRTNAGLVDGYGLWMDYNGNWQWDANDRVVPQP